MRISYDISFCCEASPSVSAAELFCDETEKRTGKRPAKADCAQNADVIFRLDGNISRDGFSMLKENSSIVLAASGIRGFVFAIGYFLRKASFKGFIELPDDIFGNFAPDKSIRGHQLGYRTTPNTYDAWTYDDYFRYYLDLMYFGVNTVEHIPFENGRSARNELMIYDEEEFLVKTCETADELDLDISLWHPNYDDETDESAAETRKRLYSKLKRLDAVMIPGGDPGRLPADVFMRRVRSISKAMKEVHPEAKMYPSAQSPGFDGWGDTFVRELLDDSEGIDGVVFGPNHAMPLEDLYDKLGGKYPIRLYPDITHNVRCEYPVHYDRDDWNFALTTGLSRECTNPRPFEYAKLHKETSPYVVGSVSYSEGITDDVNKVIWSSFDWNPDQSVEEILLDYSRLYFYGADEKLISDLIISLEKNWEGNIDSNTGIDETIDKACKILHIYPFLGENWRFVQLYLRAVCDKFLRDRRLFELSLIERSKEYLLNSDSVSARNTLQSNLPEEIAGLREEISALADKMFKLIGYQSDIEHYHANNWERGAILETIDLPITDRQWLLSKYEQTDDYKDLLSYYSRNEVKENEYYFSVALNGISEKQDGEVYMNFQGDRPDVNRGDLPTALFNIFDNVSFVHTVNGLSDDIDYELHVTYLDKKKPEIDNFTIRGNGKTIYCGTQFGEPDYEYDRKFCKKGFVSYRYSVPKGFIKDGSLKLEFAEPVMCVMIAEFSLKIAR